MEREKIGSRAVFWEEISGHVKCDTPLTHPSKDREYLLHLGRYSLRGTDLCLYFAECSARTGEGV